MSARARIGAAGGELVSSDGAVTLRVPAGALSSEIDVEIVVTTETGPNGALAPVYDLRPDGTTFEVPVLLVVEASNGTRPTMVTFDETTQTWRDLPSLVDGDTVAAFLEHFSWYTVRGNGPEPVTPIDATISPGTRTRVPYLGYEVWEASNTVVTVSGVATPDGTGRWHGGGLPSGPTQGTFAISGGVFSFTFDICASGNQLSLIAISSNMQIDLALPPGVTCDAPPRDGGVRDGGPGGSDGGSVDAGPPDSGVAGTGDLDPTFGNGGIATNPLPSTVTFMNDATNDSMDRVIVVGTARGMGTDFFVARYLPDGTPDMSFGTGGVFMYSRTGGNADGANTVVTDAQDNIYVAGTTRINSVYQPDLTVVKIDPAGTLLVDTHLELDAQNSTFHTPHDIAIDSAGRVIVTSWDRIAGSNQSGMSIWRLSSNLGVDQSFGDFATGVSHWTRSTFSDQPSFAINSFDDLTMTVDANDRPLVTAGWSTSGGPDGKLLIRITDAGALDPTFGDDVYPADGTPDGAWRPEDGVDESWLWYDLAIDATGGILVSGQRSTLGANPATVWRVLPTGVLDTSFGAPDGYSGWLPPDFMMYPRPSDFALSLTIDGSGRVVTTGSTWLPSQSAAVWRMDGTGTYDGSFGLDGRAEFSANPNAITGLRHVFVDSSDRIVGVGYTQYNVTIYRVLP